MANNTDTSPSPTRRGVTWIMHGVTWCALIALLVSSGLLTTTGTTGDPATGFGGDLELSASIWEDASGLAPESSTSTSTSTSTSSLTTAMTTSSSLDDGAKTVETMAGAENLSWIADLGGWVPNMRPAVELTDTSLTGAGIDIALIDSGVTPVAGLNGPGKVLNGPDLSTDASSRDLVNLDLFGHGTHMAGIIAGKDTGPVAVGSPVFSGVAPGARIVNLKVADGAGNTSPEQVVAAIEWAIVHRNDPGMNIRVIALALGHGETDYRLDPLAAALERAWAKGIVVVVAGGNRGVTSGGLDSPAIDPYVISVAGAHQADPTNIYDDTVASWSSSGNGVRNPDIAVPGKSMVSLRVPGSYADQMYPESALGGRFAVASGTSQSTAVAAGTVALLLEKYPALSPDQVKRALASTGRSLETGETRDGKGRMRLDPALALAKRGRLGAPVQQFHQQAVAPESFGTTSGGWAGGSWNGATWSGGTWSGATWSGATWSGATWSGATWSGATWSGATWSGATWSGATWSGATWSGATWSAGNWS